MDYNWTCACCGQQYNTLPTAWARMEPDQWLEIPEEERSSRGVLTEEVCLIYNTAYFFRGRLRIPIIGSTEYFAWCIWVSVSEQSKDRIRELWSETDVGNEPPMDSWLANDLSQYPPTLNLKARFHFRGWLKPPLIKLEPTDHPLFIEQRDGISMQRIEEIATRSH